MRSSWNHSIKFYFHILICWLWKVKKMRWLKHFAVILSDYKNWNFKGFQNISKNCWFTARDLGIYKNWQIIPNGQNLRHDKWKDPSYFRKALLIAKIFFFSSLHSEITNKSNESSNKTSFLLFECQIVCVCLAKDTPKIF